MSILTILIVLIVAGVILYLVNNYIPVSYTHLTLPTILLV